MGLCYYYQDCYGYNHYQVLGIHLVDETQRDHRYKIGRPPSQQWRRATHDGVGLLVILIAAGPKILWLLRREGWLGAG